MLQLLRAIAKADKSEVRACLARLSKINVGVEAKASNGIPNLNVLIERRIFLAPACLWGLAQSSSSEDRGRHSHIHLVGSYSQPAILAASQSPDIRQLLVQHGADAAAADSFGTSLLVYDVRLST